MTSRGQAGVAVAERPARSGFDSASHPGDLPASGIDSGELAALDIAAWESESADGQVPGPHWATAPPAAAGVIAPGAAAPQAGLDARAPVQDALAAPARAPGHTRAATARARKAARRTRRTRMVLASLCLPAIAITAVLTSGHHSGAPAPVRHSGGQKPTAALSDRSSAPALGTWQHIGTRAEDPLPLTLAQFFPARFTGGGVSYERTAQLGGTNCAAAVFGASLQAAVRRNGCTQVMRASYLAAAQRIMGTIGVLNLADSSGASKAGQVTGSSQFIAQLAAAAGPTHNLAKGTGVEEAEVKGHYLILTWAEFTSLRAPQTARQAAMLKAFSAELIRATVNVSLTSRMVTGKPEVP